LLCARLNKVTTTTTMPVLDTSVIQLCSEMFYTSDRTQTSVYTVYDGPAGVSYVTIWFFSFVLRTGRFDNRPLLFYPRVKNASSRQYSTLRECLCKTKN